MAPSSTESRLCAEEAGSRGRAVLGDEAADIDEPGARVELGVDGVDQPRVLVAGRRLHGLGDDDAGDELGSAGRDDAAPADEDGVAVVPEVEKLEGDRRLTALASLKGGAGVEGGGTLLQHLLAI